MTEVKDLGLLLTLYGREEEDALRHHEEPGPGLEIIWAIYYGKSRNIRPLVPGAFRDMKQCGHTVAAD